MEFFSLFLLSEMHTTHTQTSRILTAGLHRECNPLTEKLSLSQETLLLSSQRHTFLTLSTELTMP